MARARRRAANAKASAPKERNINDTIVLAFMFLGLGVGVAFGQAGPGLLIGAGIGILARGISKYSKTDPTAIALSFGVAGYIVGLIGVYFIFLGISLLEGVTWVYPYGASVPLVVIGLILLIIFFRKRL